MNKSNTPDILNSSDSKTWYKKLSDYKTNRENPFLKDVVTHLQVSTQRQTLRPNRQGGIGKLLVIDDLGNEHGRAGFERFIEVDQEKFTKLFRAGIAEINQLSVRGTKVWCYVCDELKPGATSFHFMTAKCLAHTGYKTRGNVLSGLAELLGADIIARSEDSSLYFINPKIMFNGSRLTFAKTYIKEQLREKGQAQYELELRPHMSLSELRALSKSVGNE